MSEHNSRVGALRKSLQALGVTFLVGAVTLAGAAAADARPAPKESGDVECVRIVLWDGSSILSCTLEQGTWPPLT